MRVPFLDVGAAYAELSDELDSAYHAVMASGRYLLGEQLEAFELEFAEYVGSKYSGGVGSGLDALTLSLRALEVAPGDEVIVPTNTTAATWQAVAAVGAVPVGVEPLESTHTVDPAGLDSALSARTKAVIPVHLYGRPAAMGPILAWADDHGLAVLADAAQAHGARLDDQPIGGLGDAVAWSFYPSKNLGAFSDGGMVTTNDPDVITRVRRLRNYGAEERDNALEIGTNSRLDELQAAFLRVRLSHLDSWNARRRANAERYLSALALLPIGLPPADDATTMSSWHQFVVRTSERSIVQTALTEVQIDTMVHYPIPPFAQPAFAGLGIEPGRFPIASRLAKEVLSLPVGPHLDPTGLDEVIAALVAITARVETQISSA